MPNWQAQAARAAEQQRVLERAVNAAVRGAATGFALRGGLNVASIMLGLTASARRRPQRGAPAVSHLINDSIRYAAFLGSLGGLYVAVEEAIAAWLGKDRTSSWRALVAGMLCGPTILLTGPGTSHTSLSLYILLRSLVLLVRAGNKPGHPLRLLLAPSRWPHGDTALMCVSTVQLAYSWIFLQRTLPRSYVRFLNKHGGKQQFQYNAIKEFCERNAARLPPARLASLSGTSLGHLAPTRPCDFLHPGQPCASHAALFALAAYARALPVYVPVYLLPALLVHRRKLLVPGPDAAQLWRKMALGVARSAAFLTLYCTFAWTGVCTSFAVGGPATPLGLAASAWVAGLATLAEKKSRRMELAIYCLSRAVESFALCTAEWGWVNRATVPARLDVLMFSCAVGAIMHCYSDGNGNRRDCFRSKYLNVLDFIFGNEGVEAGAIKHVPSTESLLTRLAASPSLLQLSTLRAHGKACGGGKGEAPAMTYAAGDTQGQGDEDREESSAGKTGLGSGTQGDDKRRGGGSSGSSDTSSIGSASPRSGNSPDGSSVDGDNLLQTSGAALRDGMGYGGVSELH